MTRFPIGRTMAFASQACMAAAFACLTLEARAQPAAPAEPSAVSAPRTIAGLPNDHGQVYREYDLRGYTSRVRGVERPQQAVVDWILRETGTEIWFSEPAGMLNATREKLRVYHTPEMHELVAKVVDKLLASGGRPEHLSLKLVTINSPSWRSRAMPLMRRVAAQSPGVDAWLVSKENAAILAAELRKRTDYREHNAPSIVLHNGQPHALTQKRPRVYGRSVRRNGNAFGGFEIESDQVQEGYRLEISPLVSQGVIDAVIRCEIDQVERLVPVHVDVPTIGAQTQRAQIQVPQFVSWRLHERFRWPADHVLVLSCGVVASPAPQRAPILGGIGNFRLMEPLGITNPMAGASKRADALLFVESKGPADRAGLPAATTATRASISSGRY